MVDASYLIGSGIAHAKNAALGKRGQLYKRSRIVAIDAKENNWYLHNAQLTTDQTLLLIKGAAPASVLVSTLTPDSPWPTTSDYKGSSHSKNDGWIWDRNGGGTWQLNQNRIIKVPPYQLIWIDIIKPNCPFFLDLLWSLHGDVDGKIERRSMRWPAQRPTDDE